MKRGKDEKMMMGPMFPRLHVNDADKGGPRAPPRNKMALYEQFSIPSQRFNNNAANLTPSNQPPSQHQSEKQFTQYSDLSVQLTQVEHRKKLDEDDFRVPIFVHSFPSQECGEFTNASNFNPPLKCQKAKKTSVLESKTRQESKIHNEKNLEEFAADRIKAISTSSTIEKAEDPKRQTDNTDDIEPELCAEYNLDSKRCNTSVLEGKVASPSEDRNILHDISNETESQDRPCILQKTRNLERVDSVSENSVVDSISKLDITPDDVVGVIGQKQFWKARRAISDQQRVFSVQVFELHRLIKVQKLIAASPHLLVEDSSFSEKPTKPLLGKRKPLSYPIKEIPNFSKQKGESEILSHKNERSAENTVENAPVSSVQTGLPTSNIRPMSGPASGYSPSPSINSNYNPGPWCFNPPPQANHWLIPVMSPSEGLVYKPYPGPPGLAGPGCGGCGPPGSNPPMANFPTPAYGFPSPHPQYAGPHGYFPTYGMPIMNAGSFSGSQTNGPPITNQTLARNPNLSTMESHKNRASPDGLDDEDVEVQASIASSPVERVQNCEESKFTEERNVLPLFPTSPPIDTSKTSSQPSEHEGSTTRVIKVVPHNPRLASESAARIFQSIQEERKQYDFA